MTSAHIIMIAIGFASGMAGLFFACVVKGKKSDEEECDHQRCRGGLDKMEDDDGANACVRLASSV